MTEIFIQTFFLYFIVFLFSFNPMIDLYEYKGEKLLFEPNDQYNDLPIEISVKFVSYNNEPPYGTSEYFKLNPPMMKEVA